MRFYMIWIITTQIQNHFLKERKLQYLLCNIHQHDLKLCNKKKKIINMLIWVFFSAVFSQILTVYNIFITVTNHVSLINHTNLPQFCGWKNWQKVQSALRLYPFLLSQTETFYFLVFFFWKKDNSFKMI